MATTAQLGALTLGSSSAVGGGGYLLTQYIKNNEKSTEKRPEVVREPENILTFELTTSTTDIPQNYHTKILDVIKKTNLSKIVKGKEASNEEWWKWALKYKYQIQHDLQKDSIFEEITIAYDANTGNKKALNQACEEAYVKEKALFNAPNKFLLSNIGAFCTKGQEIIDLSEPEATVIGTTGDTSYQDKFALAGDNKTKLVKVKVEATETRNYNEFWWDWAFKNRFPKKASETNTNFKKVIKGYLASETAGDGVKTSLNNACEDAYKKDKSGVEGSNDSLLTDVRKFCTKNFNDELAKPSK